MARRVGDTEAEGRWAGWFERGQVAFDVRLWRGDHYAYDDGGGPSSDSIMADQLAGQWYADATGLGDLLPPERVDAVLRTVHARNVRGFGGGRMGAVNGMRPDGSVDGSSEQSAEVWVGTTYALAAFMIGRGLLEEGWETARVRSPSPTSAGCGSGHPRPTTPTATTGPRSTSGRWPSGRSRRRSPGAPGASSSGRPPRSGRCGAGPLPGPHTTSRSTCARDRRPTARRHSPARPPRAPPKGGAR